MSDDGPAPRGLPARPDTTADDGVLVFAGLDWWYHNRAHADFQLARRIAARRRVVLVNSIGTRLPTPARSSQVIRRVRNKLSSVARLVRRPVAELPDFHVYSPLTVPAYGSRLGRGANAALLRAQIRAILHWARMPEPAVVVTPPTAWDVVRELPRSTLVFNRSDKFSAWSEVDSDYLESLERRMLVGADAVVYVAHSLMDADADLAGERGVFLDHGVDLTAFRSGLTPPADLSAIPGPRIGYFGALREHTVDVDLLVRVAEELPHAQLVLVGASTVDDSRLAALPNVHLLGQRPHETIPAYGSGFDVAIMPWRDNDWIRACNPIKMKEYLALGLPVVTTDFPEAHRYADVMRIAASGADFVAGIAEALARPGGERADLAARSRAAVADASWEAVTERLVRVIDRSRRCPRR